MLDPELVLPGGVGSLGPHTLDRRDKGWPPTPLLGPSLTDLEDLQLLVWLDRLSVWGPTFSKLVPLLVPPQPRSRAHSSAARRGPLPPQH